MPMSEPWTNEVTLAKAYRKYGSAERIAEAWGCSDRTIRTWLHRHDRIDVADRGRPASWTNKDPPNHVLEDDDGYELIESFVPERDEDGEVVHVERKSVRVHRLVAVAEWGFDEVCKSEIHHRNGMKLDNRPENLVPLDPRLHGGLNWDRRWDQNIVGDYDRGEPGPEGAPTGDVPTE